MRLGIDARKLTDYGIGTYVAHLLRGLGHRDDVALSVLSRVGHEERVRLLAPGAEVIPVAATGYGIREHVRVPMAVWRARTDLLHIPHYVVPALVPGRVVVTVHDIIQLFYPPQPRPHLALLYLRVVLRSALRRARRVITVSRTSRRDLINLFGAQPDRLVVVPNGVEPRLGERPPAEEIDEVRSVHRLRPPLILVVANDKPHKNVDVVMRAFHLAVRRHRIPGQLILVGGLGPDHPMAVTAHTLGLDERVRFLGRISVGHLRVLYHLSAVLLHVALYEGFGLPVLEAMRAGLPVITSNLGAMRELGEGSARLVNPLDVEEVAEALETVLVDDPLRRRMIEGGRKRAESLTWERTVERTLAVYREALGES